MCGRYTLTVPLDNLVEAFQVSPPDFGFSPRYNIAPTQKVPVVAQDDRGRRMGLLQWGLVPSWADDPSMGSRLINARSETVAEKPSFRSAFRRRRCLVPADGFFEWKKEEGGKTPFWIHREDRGAFGFAGLWEKWEPREGQALYTFTILTASATPELRDIHPRMPVILPRGQWEAWLDQGTEAEALGEILKCYRGPHLSAVPVSSRVNSPRHDDPACIAPPGEPAPPPGS